MPGRRRDQAKRDAIVRAASVLFTEGDFHRVLMDEVAVRAGVGKGTLYRYFRTKDDLYLATIFQGWERLREGLEAALQASGPLAERLEGIVEEILAYFWERRAFITLVYRLEHKSAGKEKAHWRRRRESIVRLVEEVLREEAAAAGSLADGDLRLMSELLLGMVRAAILHRRTDDTPGDLARLIVALFLGGFEGAGRLLAGRRARPEGKRGDAKASLSQAG
jgi:AcrR family transcriptional regulator